MAATLSNVNGYIEVVDQSAPRFTNAAQCDLVVYTDNSNQSIHLGNTTGALANVTITNSNMQIRENVIVADVNGPCMVSAGNLGMFRNRIINGELNINQRGVTACNSIGTGLFYTADRWCLSNNITTGTMSISNLTLSSGDTPFQYGFQNSLRFTAATACTNYGLIAPMQRIEGNNVRDFMWGYAFGQPATLSFWMRTSLTSNSRVPITIRNSNAAAASNTWCYATEVLSAASNAWSYYTVNIPTPGSNSLGLWDRSSNTAIEVIIGGRQTANTLTTSNAWTANSNVGTVNSIDIWSTANNFVEFTGVQLEKGNIATPFEFRAWGTELSLCQRYYEILNTVGGSWCMGYFAAAGSAYNLWFSFKCTKRIAASLVGGSLSTPSGTSVTASVPVLTTDIIVWNFNVPSAQNFYITVNAPIVVAAEL